MNIGNSELGLAGEFRVMSELLLRGHNPAKSYVDNGIDLILENGTKIQVKTTSKILNNKKVGVGAAAEYRFYLGKGNKKAKVKFSEYVDFLIFWAVKENKFWIIPSKILDMKIALTIGGLRKHRDNHYDIYENKWDSLNGGEGVNNES